MLILLPLHLISPATSPVKDASPDAETYYLALGDNDIPREAFAYALNGYYNMQRKNEKINDSILTLIDYSLPSTVQRLFIMDLKNKKLLKKSLVAHGKGTGSLHARNFSNTPQSHQSSLGFFITGKTYYGKHGYSLRISGIEKGINDKAAERAIVFHGAKYVSTKFIEEYGRLGRSFGCPALPVNENQIIIDLIKEESCVFIFYPDENYLSRSELLN